MPNLHQEADFAASPAAVYRALMDGKEHAAFTGAPAEISGEAGGIVSCYGGQVGGRNLELVPGERIVWAWRAGSWPAGAWSIARFLLRKQGKGTHLVFDQEGVPDAALADIEAGWKKMYWEPLRKHLER
jgi:uncharacterized protein YndB with AHSA1/START domain